MTAIVIQFPGKPKPRPAKGYDAFEAERRKLLAEMFPDERRRPVQLWDERLSDGGDPE